MFPNLKASLAPFVLRVGVASIFLYHGYLKLTFNGGGLRFGSSFCRCFRRLGGFGGFRGFGGLCRFRILRHAARM